MVHDSLSEIYDEADKRLINSLLHGTPSTFLRSPVKRSLSVLR